VDIEQSGKSITVRGIVVPVEWDKKGTVIAAALSTHQEEEYIIDHNEEGRKMMAFFQGEVEASGVVKKARDKKTITVNRFEIVHE
jgi:hypothetical protein